MIQGSAPYLLLSDGTKLKNLDSLLGFSMPKQDGSEGTELIDATKKLLTAPKGMKLSDVKALVVADNQAHTVPIGNLKDDDGDIVSPLGTITAVWKANGQVMSDLNQQLNLCGGVYTLTISINHLQAQTTYGIPYQGDNYGSATKTYTFIANGSGICYIQPQSMAVFKVDGDVYPDYPEGYNPAVWEVDKGFSVSKMRAANKWFPTTGFHKAVFDLIGTGDDQSKYRCSTKGDWVKLSGDASQDLGQNCRVTYNHDKNTGNPTKPTTPITITMEYQIADNEWHYIDSYTIPVPQKWAISNEMDYGYQTNYADSFFLEGATQFPVLDICRKIGPRADNGTTLSKTEADRRGEVVGTGNGLTKLDQDFRQKYLYRRDELTNGAAADRTLTPEGERSYDGRWVSRDIGTFIGEWGFILSYSSLWGRRQWIWTAEVGFDGFQRTVHSGGIIANESPWNPKLVVCRGD